jgi:(4-(4-[2-(gamma-L-glutamylamino)ethyl]phenoxymethyl)furan-2-yl)methanamine synthase
MQANTVGWDIGGAHLKAAVINQHGELIGIFQQACPLWKGLEYLQSAVNTILQAVDQASISQHAITMTGELVDLFADRDDGVKQIIATMTALLPDSAISVFTGSAGLIALPDISTEHYAAIASANWLASALFAAQHIEQGLFVDIGSTTTDILLLQDKQVLAQGYSDYQRLISKELIYTGIIRTAVMAVTRTVQDNGYTVGVMAEYFATMADVYRLTGELQEHHDQTDTADGSEKTVSASAKRLARMIGCDTHLTPPSRWQQLANNIRQQQLMQIQQACQIQLQRRVVTQPITLIGAGVGRFLVKDIALNLQQPYVDFSDLFILPTQFKLAPADCAPALAVATLSLESLH